MDARSRLKVLIAEKCVLKGEFVLASGLRSKVFFDCKRVTLDPEGLHLIAGILLDMIDDLARRDGRPIDATGGSTIEAIRKAQEVGLEIACVIAIVDREQGGAESLARYRYYPLFKKSEFGL